jgi:hypothetical protein
MIVLHAAFFNNKNEHFKYCHPKNFYIHLLRNKSIQMNIQVLDVFILNSKNEILVKVKIIDITQ